MNKSELFENIFNDCPWKTSGNCIVLHTAGKYATLGAARCCEEHCAVFFWASRLKEEDTREILVCPICGCSLVFPRNDYAYCEECGWPDEDRGDEYVLPQVGEDLRKYQPGLEFFNGVSWKMTEIISSTMFRMPRDRRGMYRRKKEE